MSIMSVQSDLGDRASDKLWAIRATRTTRARFKVAAAEEGLSAEKFINHLLDDRDRRKAARMSRSTNPLRPVE